MKHNEWMLWQDGDSSKAPADVLQEAIYYYQAKYGLAVTHIRAPLDFPKVAKVEGILLNRKRDVQSGHLMLTHQIDGQVNAGVTGRNE